MYSTGIVVTSPQDHWMIKVVQRGNTGNNKLGTEEKNCFWTNDRFFEPKKIQGEEVMGREERRRLSRYEVGRGGGREGEQTYE